MTLLATDITDVECPRCFAEVAIAGAPGEVVIFECDCGTEITARLPAEDDDQ